MTTDTATRKKVHLVWDGSDTVEIPPPMGAPREDQLQGTLAEKVAELACRVCYDSLGSKRSRDTADNLAHIIEVGHLSVLEHFHATTLLFVTPNSRGPVIESLAQRPGVYWRFVPGAGPGAFRITCNARSVLEWERWTDEAQSQAGYPVEMATAIGKLLQVEWHNIAPLLIQEPHGAPGAGVLSKLSIGSMHITTPDDPSEVWITLYMEGSRGFSHELVRHGDRTAISQRSTRYVNEAESDWDWHPLIHAFLADDSVPEPTRTIVRLNAREVEDKARHTYAGIVKYLQPWLTDKIPESDPYRKHTARKQARGAARGFLGNALRTAVIFTANIPQWRHMMGMRAADAADAEIRCIFAEALPLLQSTCYGSLLEDLTLAPAGDGIGSSLAGGGAS